MVSTMAWVRARPSSIFVNGRISAEAKDCSGSAGGADGEPSDMNVTCAHYEWGVCAKLTTLIGGDISRGTALGLVRWSNGRSQATHGYRSYTFVCCRTCIYR